MKGAYSRSSYNTQWRRVGYTVTADDTKIKYVVDCNMKDGMLFDEMRGIMYDQKKLDNYTPGQATNEEILAVLSFARQYYRQKYSSKDER